MQSKLFALLLAMVVSFLPLSLRAQTSFVTVSSSKLTDVTGAAANAQVCAQAVDPMSIAISVHVKGGGVTTTQQVCTNAVAGVWSLSLPNTLLTIPGNAGFNITATDNVTGISLIGPGYTYVQPTSDSNSHWCTTSNAGLTNCNFDNLPPMVKPTVQTVWQGPAGKDGATGPAGCVVGSTCASVPLQQPTTDQYSSNIVYMAPVGDVPARANAMYQAAVAAGKGLNIVLTGLAPISSTELLIPTEGGIAYSFTCENSAGLQYAGPANAVRFGSNYSFNPDALRGCRILVDFTQAKAAVSTCTANIGVFGVNILDNYVLPLDYSKIPGSSTVPFDICGNVVAPYLHGNYADRGYIGYQLRPSLGTFVSGVNGALLDHNVSSNMFYRGVSITGAGHQNVTVQHHLDEGSGCPLSTDGKNTTLNNTGSGSGIGVEFSQGSSFLDNYLESNGCGIANMVVGATGGLIDALHVAGGTLAEPTGGSNIILYSGTNVTIDPFTVAGTVGSHQLTLPSTFTGNNNRFRVGVNNLSRTYQPEEVINGSDTVWARQLAQNNFPGEPSQFGLHPLNFPLGTCTPVIQLPLQSKAFTIQPITGEWQAADGSRISYGHYDEITDLKPTMTVGTSSVTFSVDSTGILCGTPSGSAVGFSGVLSASGLTQSVVSDFGNITAVSIKPQSLNTPTPTVGTTCTVGGYVTVTIDGTARKLAYCN